MKLNSFAFSYETEQSWKVLIFQFSIYYIIWWKCTRTNIIISLIIVNWCFREYNWNKPKCKHTKDWIIYKTWTKSTFYRSQYALSHQNDTRFTVFCRNSHPNWLLAVSISLFRKCCIFLRDFHFIKSISWR